MKITKDGVDYERFFDVTRYPCPNGCRGSMYFTDDGAGGIELECPFCECVAVPDAVTPIHQDVVDIPMEDLA